MLATEIGDLLLGLGCLGIAVKTTHALLGYLDKRGLRSSMLATPMLIVTFFGTLSLSLWIVIRVFS